MNKISVILQARMHSTRLPNKVVTEICGKQMLWHIIERLKYCKLVDDIIVTTTTHKDDDVLVKLAKQCKVKHFRGSEENVLDRYYQCSLKHKIHIIVNITGDCPLVDPKIVDSTIQAYLDNRKWADYVRIYVIKDSFPRGLDCDVFPRRVLIKTWGEATKKHDLSNATSYMYQSGEFNVLTLKLNKNLSKLRWTVDTAKDLLLIRLIYNRLYPKKKIFYIDDVLELLIKEPWLTKINQKVKQKAIEEG